jgi:hypothetical protein
MFIKGNTYSQTFFTKRMGVTKKTDRIIAKLLVAEKCFGGEASHNYCLVQMIPMAR